MAETKVKKTFIAHSRIDWHKDPKDEVYPGDEEMKIGCLQRIALATELMATNFVQLQNDKERLTRWYNEQREETRRLERRINSLKGVITKLKNKTKK